MTPAEFVEKWRPVDLPERAASQEHFIDLCRLLGQPTPAEHDATGAEYTFEKGVTVTGAASVRSPVARQRPCAVGLGDSPVGMILQGAGTTGVCACLGQGND